MTVVEPTVDIDAFLDDLALEPDRREKVLAAYQRSRVRIERMEREYGHDPLASPADFAVALSKGRWQPYEWLRYLNDEIVAFLGSDDEDVMVVTTPPRHGKTEFVSHWLPAWFIAAFKLRVGLASYESDFAAQHGRWVRDLLEEHGERWGIRIRHDSKAASRWDAVDQLNAGMWTAGAGGPITGKGYWLGVIDDPIKNAEKADSLVEREKQGVWWLSTWLTRREPGGKTIVILTRWHFDDLGGRIVDTAEETGLRIRHVNLPATAREGDEMDREVGEALCPERFDAVALDKIKLALGGRVWSALYMQEPQIEGGSVFKRENFRYYRLGKDYVLLGGHVVERAAMTVVSTMDTAYTRGRRSDFTVVGTWGVVAVNGITHGLLLNLHRRQVLSTEHVQLVKQVWAQDKPAWLGIEKINASLSLLSDAQRHGVVVRELIPDKSKDARAETAAALYESHRIWHPQLRPDWLQPFENELVQFPLAQHDDCVDVTAYFANEMARGVLAARHVKHEPEVGSIDAHLAKFKKGRHRRHPIIGGRF